MKDAINQCYFCGSSMSLINNVGKPCFLEECYTQCSNDQCNTMGPSRRDPVLAVQAWNMYKEQATPPDVARDSMERSIIVACERVMTDNFKPFNAHDLAEEIIRLRMALGTHTVNEEGPWV